jgi:hypothetical protein
MRQRIQSFIDRSFYRILPQQVPPKKDA